MLKALALPARVPHELIIVISGDGVKGGKEALEPPFALVKNEHGDAQPNWSGLLDFVKNEGKKDASVQRYKGLGEMNAEQLAETTMNPEKRTLLQVRLEDAVESEEIFSTLMARMWRAGGSSSKNALDVKNLDV